MNNFFKKSVAAVIVAANLCGCATQNYTIHKNKAESIHKNISAETALPKTLKIREIDTPPVNIKPIKETVKIPWESTPISINVSEMPLSIVLNQIFDNVLGVKFWLDSEVDPNKLVSLRFHGTLKDCLNMLSSETSYGIKSLPHEVKITKYETETFAINFPSGTYSGQLGGGGDSGGSKEGEDTHVAGQFLSVRYNDVDMFQQITSGIKSILQREGGAEGQLTGTVEAVPALTSITVSTTPSRMRKVRSLVEHFQEQLEKQVVLDVRVLEFRSTGDKDLGINWDLVKKFSEGILKFYIPSTTLLANGQSYGLAFEGTDSWDGTSALIKALSEQGDVSTETPITALALNGQPSRISQTMTIPYINEVKSEANENVVSTSVTRAQQSEGVDMMITPSVHKDYVWLRIAGKLTKIVNRHVETVKDTKLTFLDTRNSEINFVNRLRYGQTVVIASIKQKTTSSSKSVNFGISGLGSEATSNKTTETLVLLTPRRAD